MEHEGERQRLRARLEERDRLVAEAKRLVAQASAMFTEAERLDAELAGELERFGREDLLRALRERSGGG